MPMELTCQINIVVCTALVMMEGSYFLGDVWYFYNALYHDHPILSAKIDVLPQTTKDLGKNVYSKGRHRFFDASPNFQNIRGPRPMQLVVVMAVRKAVSAATTTFTAISMNLFFIVIHY